MNSIVQSSVMIITQIAEETSNNVDLKPNLLLTVSGSQTKTVSQCKINAILSPGKIAVHIACLCCVI